MLTLKEAVDIMTNENAHKYPHGYVRVGNRDTRLYDVEGGYLLVSRVIVYSKTWSVRRSRLYASRANYEHTNTRELTYPLWLDLREAKKLLKKQTA